MKYFLLPFTAFILLTSCISPKDVNFNLIPRVTVPVQLVTNYGGSSGSGVIISCRKEGDLYRVAILTASHVVEPRSPEDQISVIILNKKCLVLESIPHPKFDLTILIIKSDQAVPAAPLDLREPALYSEVCTAGYPINGPLVVSTGLLNRSIANNINSEEPLWLCTAPVYSGNSGGGVFDKKTKKLIGITLRVGLHVMPNGMAIIVPHLQICMPIHYVSLWIEESVHG